MPRLFPVVKKRSSPLRLKLSIATELSVTHVVTCGNPDNRWMAVTDPEQLSRETEQMATVGIVGGLVHERYIGELLKGDFRDETRQRFISLVNRLRAEEAIDGVVLGGTELPLLLTGPVIADVPALDTTALHVAAIVKRLRRT
jgi:hypothetical protein